MALPILRTTEELRAQLGDWRCAGESVGLVPTMGALHEGHLSLVRLCRAATARTCVTLFVNPKQFAPGEDLARYPRDEAADAALLEAEGADALYAPDVGDVYGPGFATRVVIDALGDDLEGAFRPGFFEGIATVVTKLLMKALPDAAFFGEKDYQQLVVIRRLVADLDIPVAIEAAPTVREADGLAAASRNAYLSPAERKRAPRLFRAITYVARTVGAGGDADRACADARQTLLDAGFTNVDYVAVRDALTLGPPAYPARPARVLAAARLGTTRLIDNVAVAPEPARDA